MASVSFQDSFEPGWPGSVQDCAELLKPLFKIVPKLNARVFKQAVLSLSVRDAFAFLPNDNAGQEEEAASLRAICFHVRREWYQGNNLALGLFLQPTEAQAATREQMAFPAAPAPAATEAAPAVAHSAPEAPEAALLRSTSASGSKSSSKGVVMANLCQMAQVELEQGQGLESH